jgi:Coenzyme PQQ synthesis protein D (PqqD).
MIRQESIAADCIVVQKPGAIVSDMDGEKVMLSVENGKYYNLGKQGGRIWELIAAPMTIPDLVSALTAEYDIDRETCERDVLKFLSSLHRENMIEVTRR